MLCQFSYAGSAGGRAPGRRGDARRRCRRGGPGRSSARHASTVEAEPMRYKAMFVTGFAAGYVLGARAGRQRYEQIDRAWHRLLGRPEVRRAADVARHEAIDLVGTAKRAVTERFAGRDVTDEVRANGSL